MAFSATLAIEIGRKAAILEVFHFQLLILLPRVEQGDFEDLRLLSQ
jgi:hypothetical protein